MTISKSLNTAININIQARNFSEEVTVVSESQSGDDFSLYNVLNKNNVLFQRVPGSANIKGKGILGFVGGDKSRPALIGGATVTTNTTSTATAPTGPGGSWPVADIGPVAPIDPSLDADSQLLESAPTTNFGSGSSFSIRTGTSPGLIKTRGILQFNTGDISFTTATLRLYLWQGNGTGNFPVDVVRVTQLGLVEAEVTWNKYNVSNSWAISGGDFTEDDKASTTILSSQDDEHITWNITALVNYARANNSGILDIIVKLQSELTDTTTDLVFLTKETFLGEETKPLLILT